MIGSIILALHFLGVIPHESAVNALYISGILLIVAEFGVISFGVLALNGILSLYAAYALQTGVMAFLGIKVGWEFVFAVAVIEFAVVMSIVYIWKKMKSQKIITGTEGMIGQKVQIEQWSGKTGRILFEGESWTARTTQERDFKPGDEATVQSVSKLRITVE